MGSRARRVVIVHEHALPEERGAAEQIPSLRVVRVAGHRLSHARRRLKNVPTGLTRFRGVGARQHAVAIRQQREIDVLQGGSHVVRGDADATVDAMRSAARMKSPLASALS